VHARTEEALKRREAGETLIEIARSYNVSHPTIYRASDARRADLGSRGRDSRYRGPRRRTGPQRRGADKTWPGNVGFNRAWQEALAVIAGALNAEFVPVS
jgi:hypothetical protein